MARPLHRSAVPFVLLLMLAVALPSRAQLSQLDQIQVAPPMRQVPPPSPDASAKELERQADQLRSQKAYIDAIDYFEAAIKKDSNSATLYNKLGISELMLQRFREAGKHFETALKKDRKLAEAYNNLGVVNYERKKYRGA
ncbi:MAG TPA: tetratricopeptide repeat protein, partial [Terriglobales bacterium]|nr:tetratricopeptide repeat protein [Terriglobales bacterium]